MEEKIQVSKSLRLQRRGSSLVVPGVKEDNKHIKPLRKRSSSSRNVLEVEKKVIQTKSKRPQLKKQSSSFMDKVRALARRPWTRREELLAHSAPYEDETTVQELMEKYDLTKEELMHYRDQLRAKDEDIH